MPIVLLWVFVELKDKASQVSDRDKLSDDKEKPMLGPFKLRFGLRRCHYILLLIRPFALILICSMYCTSRCVQFFLSFFLSF